MCGICGYVGIPVDISMLEMMVQSLRHRGPDDFGYWTNNKAALGHTRLAIIDLTEAASQPMTTQDSRYVLVFNGEIYNYRELRRNLEQDGEVFQSTSDTEVILLGYRKWGKEILERLRGMFAFAIWDAHLQQLFLARDRIGIKPLFYAPMADGLAFASEIKAMLEHPKLSREMNESAMDLYLTLGYVPGPDTIFRNIRAIMPGCWLEWREGKLQIHQYWTPDFTSPFQERDEDDLIEELDEKLNDAVKAHLVADVPVGAFLSGGVDSSLIAAIAQKHSPESLRTYTIGFSSGMDERHFARTVATHINSKHQERL
ncbi:MAG: asparagine synthase (glutamine-hydrolyzing), partial [Dehalococcoidia bacterium]